MVEVDYMGWLRWLGSWWLIITLSVLFWVGVEVYAKVPEDQQWVRFAIGVATFFCAFLVGALPAPLRPGRS